MESKFWLPLGKTHLKKLFFFSGQTGQVLGTPLSLELSGSKPFFTIFSLGSL